MKKKIVVTLEAETEETDNFIRKDIKQEITCASVFYEIVDINIYDE